MVCRVHQFLSRGIVVVCCIHFFMLNVFNRVVVVKKNVVVYRLLWKMVRR